jgi:hypothetical protein
MQATATPGYSGTPLAKKLGFKERSTGYLIDAPKAYLGLVEPLPPGVNFASRLSERVDIVHVFATRRAALAKHLSTLRTAIRPDAVVWVSWPKKAAKVPTDITEGTIREVGLPIGFVDIKVCAVSDVWSGLKLVIRKELR